MFVNILIAKNGPSPIAFVYSIRIYGLFQRSPGTIVVASSREMRIINVVDRT